PVLIDPKGRAKSIEILVRRASEYAPAQQAPRADDASLEAELKAVQSAWEQANELAKTSPPPWTFAPERWRLYVETLLRIEELVRAGDPASAAKLRDKVGPLAEEITRARAEGRQSHRLSTAMPRALGLSPSPEAEKLLDGFEKNLAAGQYEACEKTL